MHASNDTSRSTPSIRKLLSLTKVHLVTIPTCSAITHGISHLVGQIAVGSLADLVLWKPENFGAKPEMVLKSGVIVWAQVRIKRDAALTPFIRYRRWVMRMRLFLPFSHSSAGPCGVHTRALQHAIRSVSFQRHLSNPGL